MEGNLDVLFWLPVPPAEERWDWECLVSGGLFEDWDAAQWFPLIFL